MAYRRSARAIVATAMTATLVLAACDESTTSPSTTAASGNSSAAAVPAGQSDERLRQQAAAMQRTILEGAAAGAALGAGIGIGFGGTRSALLTGLASGAAAGAAAGTYVGFLQKRYSNEEQRLEQVKSDLDQNAVEIQTTINVMREVLASQQRELSSLRSQVSNGTATQAQLSAQVSQANANLQQMQIAIDGATKRQSEFGAARGLTLVSGSSTSPIDGDLSALSNQIASMKSIANDLATSI